VRNSCLGEGKAPAAAKEVAEKVRFCVVLKGRGFQPRRKYRKISNGFSRQTFGHQTEFFSSLFSRRG
jgi:hypothetical protein